MVEMINHPGVFALDAESYHQDPCPTASLSASIAKIILNETPLHAAENHPRINPYFIANTDEKFDIGSAGHALMLGDPRQFEIIDATDWRTKDAKEQRERARAAGKIPLLTEQWERVTRMVAMGRDQLAKHLDAADAFTNGKPEQTLIWREGEIWLRARLDWLPDDRKIFDDYKTTESANPDTFQRIIFSVGHDVQAAFYRRGIRKLGLCENPVFRFIVQETSEPHALSVIGLTPGALDLADRKVEEAITRWSICLKSNRWPAWPNRTCYIDTPAWHEAQYLEREVRDHDAAKSAGVKHVLELSGIDRHGSIVP